MAFVEYNENPKKRRAGDCAIRAVAVATGLGWDEAFKQLAKAGFELKYAMSDVESVHKVLTDNGFSVGTIKVSKGMKRPTVDSFASSHPDMYCVLRVANHLVASGRGNYVDTWDSGDKAVYKYWYKHI